MPVQTGRWWPTPLIANTGDCNSYSVFRNLTRNSFTGQGRVLNLYTLVAFVLPYEMIIPCLEPVGKGFLGFLATLWNVIWELSKKVFYEANAKIIETLPCRSHIHYFPCPILPWKTHPHLVKSFWALLSCLKLIYNMFNKISNFASYWLGLKFFSALEPWISVWSESISL